MVATSYARQDGSDLAYFLQMQTRSQSEGALSSPMRTLNGQYFQKPEDLPQTHLLFHRSQEHNDPWFVVFRLRGKEDLNAAT